jgi:aldose 1-epimerase
MTLVVGPFGTTPDGEEVLRYQLAAGPVQVDVLNYGGIVSAVHAPDRTGRPANVVLGFPELAGYLTNAPYFGCITGRYANRIAGGRFSVDGHGYQIPRNDGPNALHGGSHGLNKRVWKVEETGDASIRLTHTSPDGDQGFPGTVELSVAYALSADGSLRIEYVATTDAPTVLNLTNHSYFNLAGEGSGDVYRHLLWLNACHYTPVREGLIPTGAIEPVAGTPLDFTAPTPIGARIREGFPCLVNSHGYDHNYVLDGGPLAARVVEPESGRVLTVSTTEPGLQFYSGNFLDGTLVGPAGRAYRQGDAFALETQHFPDSPNHPEFPTTLVRPGEEYRSSTTYSFSVE